MTHKKSIAVIGGDARLYYTAAYFAQQGETVFAAGSEKLACGLNAAELTDLSDALRADILVFGLPFTKDGEFLFAPFAKNEIPLKDIYKQLHAGQTVYAGMLSPAAIGAIRDAGAAATDYFRNEALTLMNARLTAEALAGLLILRLPHAVFGAKIAVTGFGRIGEFLALTLKALGADTTAYARSPLQRAKARALGLRSAPLETLTEQQNRFHALVNTVPSPILGEKALAQLNRDCVLFEAASAPYGIDAAAAERLKMTRYPAAGLPGKYAPESAGRFIAQTILQTEREVIPNASP